MWAFRAANDHCDLEELLRNPKIVRGWHECPACKKRIPSKKEYKIHVSRVHGMKI